jgi:hypothetical protein
VKKIFLTVFIVVNLSVFGQTSSDETMIMVRGAQIYAYADIIGSPMPINRIPMLQGAVRTSPDTLLIRGSGLGGDESLVVITTDNILGIVAVARTDTGPNTKESFRLFQLAVNGNIPNFQLKDAVIESNSIKGTLIHNTDGRRHRFSVDYFPQNQNLIMTIMRQ